MKRFLALLFTALLLTAAMCVSASASDYNAPAEELSAIGMFRGTEKGFELDRAPTRSEAAIMLVRLYGAEETAKTAYAAGEISHPFTDVSAFTSPYIAWLYTNGITNGFTETTFASQRPCSAQNYAVFLLRALGYKDGVDFEYANALTFAQEKGFYDPLMFSGEFLRDDLAALTYQGLAADLASGESYLLASLIDSGAIDKAAAKPMTEKFEAYRAMNAAVSNMDDSAIDMDLKMDTNVAFSMDGETMEMPASATGTVKAIVDESKVEMAYEMETTADGSTLDTSVWMKDGWMYTSMTVDGEILKVKSPVEDELAAMEKISAVDASAMDVRGLAMIESISSRRVGSNTEYTLIMNQSAEWMTDTVSGMTDEESAAADISDMTITYVVNRSGVLKRMDMVFSAAFAMPIPLEDGTASTVEMRYDYNISMTVNATGKNVRISWPNFSEFEEISSEEMDTLV